MNLLVRIFGLWRCQSGNLHFTFTVQKFLKVMTIFISVSMYVVIMNTIDENVSLFPFP
jgi:hypothetical protein